MRTNLQEHFLNDMKIVLASNNKNKIRELKEILESKLGGDVEILSLSDIGFGADIVEDGETFEENAMIKARAVSALGYIGVGDDSGLAVDALGGAPGIYSARYAGNHDDAANNRKLLSELEGETDRSAAFVCCVACSFPKSMGLEDFTVRGEARGEILLEEQGENGFGYDPLFYVPELKKTFAQMTEAEKNSISHRGAALSKFADGIKGLWRENAKQ